jgi:hypothetical protein
MNIEAKGYKLDFTLDELWQTAFDVKRALEATLKDHWINHQDAWKKHEESRLLRLNTMFSALGRLDVYEDIFKEADNVFKEYNNKQK